METKALLIEKKLMQNFFSQVTYFKVVMHSCDLFGIYSGNCEKKFFFSFIFEKLYLPVSKLSNRLKTSGLNNGRSKTGVVNMSTPR